MFGEFAFPWVACIGIDSSVIYPSFPFSFGVSGSSQRKRSFISSLSFVAVGGRMLKLLLRLP